MVPDQTRKDEFVASLIRLAVASRVDAVVLLAGVDIANRSDSQMRCAGKDADDFEPFLTPWTRSAALYHILPPNQKLVDSISGVKVYPLYTSTLPSPAREVPFIPGGGLTRRLLSRVSELASETGSPSVPPFAALVQFVMEGDNRGDAVQMAASLAKALKLEITGNGLLCCPVVQEITHCSFRNAAWQQPETWRGGLFGTPHDLTLFG